jgi:hypothetical protein
MLPLREAQEEARGARAEEVAEEEAEVAPLEKGWGLLLFIIIRLF